MNPLVALAVALPLLVAQQPAVSPAPESKTLVYADFERMEKNRPVSTRGGLIQMDAYEESHSHKSTFKGMEGADPPAPEIVRLKKDDPNHAAKFDYMLFAPNDWAGVTLEIHGLPDADGKPVPEDVSAYKTLSLQVYATGIQILRLEAISGERGKDMANTYPQMNFKGAWWSWTTSNSRSERLPRQTRTAVRSGSASKCLAPSSIFSYSLRSGSCAA